MNEPAIRIERVSKQFPGAAHPSVDQVSAEIQAGEFIVLLGPSGCGKTTLMKMINRLYEPSSGTISVNGQNILQLPATQLRRQIGYVIQQTGLFPHMRIEQNIAVVPQLLGWRTDRIDGRIDELLELIGLPHDYRSRYPRQLSGGEQQRVGIARALAADPQIMLMDEPFGAIDAITRLRLQDELLLIQRTLRKTIMFVTHDVDEALRLADRIIVMRQGKIVQFAAPLQILRAPADAFVAQLVNADDVLRQLSLLTVGSVATPGGDPPALHPEGTRAPRIHANSDLRTALATLLAADTDLLAVVDNDERVIGTLTLVQVQHATQPVEATATDAAPVPTA
jgi:osmoprotectant transport system ATP-binding protein